MTVDKAPESLTIKVCPVCGRTDLFMPFTGKSHWYRGSKCPGIPEGVKYTRVSGAA